MDAARRRRFKAWYAKTYGSKSDPRASFIRDSALTTGSPLSKGRVTQLFDEDEPFGEKAATALARRLGLDPDVFLKDDEQGPPPKPPADFSDPEPGDSGFAQLARDLPLIPAEERRQIVKSIHERAEETRKLVNKMVDERLRRRTEED